MSMSTVSVNSFSTIAPTEDDETKPLDTRDSPLESLKYCFGFVKDTKEDTVLAVCSLIDRNRVIFPFSAIKGKSEKDFFVRFKKKDDYPKDYAIQKIEEKDSDLDYCIANTKMDCGDPVFIKEDNNLHDCLERLTKEYATGKKFPADTNVTNLSALIFSEGLTQIATGTYRQLFYQKRNSLGTPYIKDNSWCGMQVSPIQIPVQGKAGEEILQERGWIVTIQQILSKNPESILKKILESPPILSLTEENLKKYNKKRQSESPLPNRQEKMARLIGYEINSEEDQMSITSEDDAVLDLSNKKPLDILKESEIWKNLKDAEKRQIENILEIVSKKADIHTLNYHLYEIVSAKSQPNLYAFLATKCLEIDYYNQALSFFKKIQSIDKNLFGEIVLNRLDHFRIDHQKFLTELPILLHNSTARIVRSLSQERALESELESGITSDLVLDTRKGLVFNSREDLNSFTENSEVRLVSFNFYDLEDNELEKLVKKIPKIQEIQLIGQHRLSLRIFEILSDLEQLTVLRLDRSSGIFMEPITTSKKLESIEEISFNGIPGIYIPNCLRWLLSNDSIYLKRVNLNDTTLENDEIYDLLKSLPEFCEFETTGSRLSKNIKNLLLSKGQP